MSRRDTSVRDGGGRGLGRPAGRLAARAGCAARWPALQADGIGGPKMAAQGFEAWWPHDKLAVRGYVEVLSHYREIAGIRRALADAPAGGQPRRLHRRRRARLQPRPRGAPASRRHPDDPLRQPVDLGLARRAHREDPAGRRPRAVHVSVRAGDLREGGRRRRPTSAIRWPTRFRSRCRAPRAAPRSASAPTTPSWRCCPAAAAPRSSTSRRACSRAAELLHRQRAGAALRPAGGARPARPDRADVPRARADGAHRAARRPLARGARGLRRDAGRQRHRHARGGALQAADGHRLRDACAQLADDEAHGATSPGSGCPTSCCASSWCPSCCRARPRPDASPTRRCAGSTNPAACEALGARFRALHDTLRCDTAQVATDAIAEVLAR